jgi:hypothetical protein
MLPEFERAGLLPEFAVESMQAPKPMTASAMNKANVIDFFI